MSIRQVELGPHVKAAWMPEDDPETLRKALGAGSLMLPKQVHGTRIEWVESPIAVEFEADGLLTGAPGLMVGIRTADCIPILLAHPATSVVGAVHAGWRGLAGGILDRLADRLAERGMRSADCDFFLGPAIGPCCYQVGAEVGKHFGLHYQGGMLDLKGFAVEKLTQAGVLRGNIHSDPSCTCCSPELPSHRRHPNAGRILTAIAHF